MSDRIDTSAEAVAAQMDAESWARRAALADHVAETLAAERDRLAAENARLREALHRCPPTSNSTLTDAQHIESIRVWWAIWARPALKGDSYEWTQLAAPDPRVAALVNAAKDALCVLEEADCEGSQVVTDLIAALAAFKEEQA